MKTARLNIANRALVLVALLVTMVVPASAQYRQPKPEQTARVALGQGLTGADLERAKIGHQAGVLKVVSADGATVKFIKGGDRLGSGGIDGREWAPLTPTERDQILTALGVKDSNAMANSLMTQYTRLSRAHALALLGVLAYPGQDTAALKPEVQAKVRQFLRNRLQPAEDSIVRRQAVLALAIQPKTDGESVAAMLNFLRRDRNAWNTFGVVQFFDYQRTTIQAMPKFQQYLMELAASGSPHADQILRELKKPAAPAATSPAPTLPAPAPATAAPAKPAPSQLPAKPAPVEAPAQTKPTAPAPSPVGKPTPIPR